MFSAISSGGLALGLIVGGALTEWASWRWVLFINVPFGIAVAGLAPRYLRADGPIAPDRRTDRSVHSGSDANSGSAGSALDLPGGLTATVGSTALVYAFIRAAVSGWGDALTIGTFAVAVVVLGAFVAIEARSARPLMPLRLFADRNRAGGYLIFLLVPAAMLGVFFFLTQILQDAMGFSPMRTGFAFLPLAVTMFGTVRLMPVLLPRFGPKVLGTTGMALMFAGLLWLSQVDAASGYVSALLGPMVLFGLGGGLGVSPMNVVIMATVPRPDMGAASGLLQTAQQVGGALGLAVLVTVYGRAGGSLVHRASAGFAAAAVFAACALLVALTLRRATSRP
jgi:MFS family permease